MISQETYNAIITQVYEAPLSGEWAGVLNNVIDVLDANKAFFFLQDLAQDAPILVNMQCAFDFPESALVEYQSRPLEDPLYHVTKTICQGDALNINNFISIEQHEDSEYFNSVLRPMRSYYAMAGILRRDGIYESPFAVARWKDQQPFNDEELRLMKRLTTHLSRAMGIYIDLQMYRKQNFTLSGLLNGQDSAQFVCSESGTIVFSNSYAADYLAEYDDIFSLDDVLTLKDYGLNETLKKLMKHCANLSVKEIETQESITLNDRSHKTALIAVSPFTARTQHLKEAKRLCLVTVKLKKTYDLDCFQQSFGLTEAEIALVGEISKSRKMSTLAKQMGKSHQTLRNQMQSIYKKCDVDSQIGFMMKLNLF